MIFAISFDRFRIIGMLAQASIMFNFVTRLVGPISSVGCMLREKITGVIIDHPHNE